MGKTVDKSQALNSRRLQVLVSNGSLVKYIGLGSGKGASMLMIAAKVEGKRMMSSRMLCLSSRSNHCHNHRSPSQTNYFTKTQV